MRKKKALTDQQVKLADGVLSGKCLKHAALDAGYTEVSASYPGVGGDGMRSLLSDARSELSRHLAIRKVDVVNGIMEAIDRAKMLGEPSTEIKGWSEVAKILGHYAPEVKKIELSVDQGRLRSKFEQLSDQELLEIAAKPVIEGEWAHVN